MSEELKAMQAKMRWIVPIVFGVMAIGPCEKLAQMVINKSEMTFGFREFLLYCVMSAVAFFFALAKRYQFRAATATVGLGYLLAGLGYMNTQHVIGTILSGVGIAIVTGSLFAMFARALEEHRGTPPRPKQGVFAAITRSIAAGVAAAGGSLVLFGLFGLGFAPFLAPDVLGIEWGFALFAFACAYIVAYTAILGGVLYESELVVAFWGKWVSYLLPSRTMVIGAGLVMIPLILSLTSLGTKSPGSETIVALTAVTINTLIIWQFKFMRKILAQVRKVSLHRFFTKK